MLIKSEASMVLEAGLSYIQRGWAVMPCLPNKKEPHFDLIQKGHLDATKNPEILKFWCKMDPKMNLGISAVGSGLLIIDIDHRNGGVLLDSFGKTYTVKSADGYHLYYKANPEARYRNGLGEGYDIKYKGYVVTAPSMHPSKVRYEVINEIEPICVPSEIEDQICQFNW